MTRRILITASLLAMLVLSGGTATAQNDDGRFVANAYITILGRTPAVHQAGMLPWGIDFGGWDWYLHAINVSSNGYATRNDVINVLIAPADTEYQNLKSKFLLDQATYPSTCTGAYLKPPFPLSSDSNYEHELFLFMAYWYGLKRCPDAPGDDSGYTYWLTRLDQNILDYGTFLTQFCNSSEYRTGSVYNPQGRDGAVSTVWRRGRRVRRQEYRCTIRSRTITWTTTSLPPPLRGLTVRGVLQLVHNEAVATTRPSTYTIVTA